MVFFRKRKKKKEEKKVLGPDRRGIAVYTSGIVNKQAN